MSSDTIDTPVLVKPVERGAVGLLDLAWLAWRQHRWLIGGTVLAGLVLFGTMLLNDAEVNSQNLDSCWQSCGSFLGTLVRHSSVGDLQTALVAAFGLVIAVFWAAPMIAREYEQRTNLLAWGQDVSPLRWLVGKVTPMVVVAVGLAMALGAAVTLLGHTFHSIDPGSYPPFTGFRFEHSVPLQAAYALFGFALGLLASAVLRRTVLAMGVTMVSYVGARLLVAALRPHFRTPLRMFQPLNPTGIYMWSDSEHLTLGFGYSDAAGQAVELNPACASSIGSDAGYEACLHRSGITNFYLDYQPVTRLNDFQWTETAIFAVLAVVLFALVALRMRRSAAEP